MISFKHRFLFLHLPKTGGNSLQWALQDYSEDELVVRHPEHQDGVERFSVHNDRIGHAKHATLQQYVDEYGQEAIDMLFVVSILRNPWDRAMSYYFSPSSNRTEFDRNAFVDCVGEMPTLREFVGLANDRANTALDAHVDALLRFESLPDEVAGLAAKIGVGEILLPHHNASTKPHYSTHYDDALVELVADKFAEEIDFADYCFETG